MFGVTKFIFVRASLGNENRPSSGNLGEMLVSAGYVDSMTISGHEKSINQRQFPIMENIILTNSKNFLLTI